MYYRTLCPCWCIAADPAWASVLAVGHRLQLRGGVGLEGEGPDAPLRVLDARYPNLLVRLDPAAFAIACTPVADPGPRTRAVIHLCDHSTVQTDCDGCWARWWIRRAQAAGVPLPRRALAGGL
jgi:hypothetical protein